MDKYIPPTDPAEAAAWIEFYYRQGWSDGLPLVPPTEESVRAMLEAGQVEAEEGLGAIAERNVTIPAEKVAINAVMAGCLPEYFPVVLAAGARAVPTRVSLSQSGNQYRRLGAHLDREWPDWPRAWDQRNP